MIRFIKEDCNVFIEVETGFFDKTGKQILAYFKRDCGSELNALVFRQTMSDRLETKVAKMREAEFKSGWKHAKAHKKGLSFFNWFSSRFSSESSH